MELKYKKLFIIFVVIVFCLAVWYFFVRRRGPSIESGYSKAGLSTFGTASVSCPMGWKVVNNKCVPDGPPVSNKGITCPPNTFYCGKPKFCCSLTMDVPTRNN